MNVAEKVFEQLGQRAVASRSRGAERSDDRDLRALPDGRIVPLEWREEKPEPEIDRGSRATFD